MANANPSRVGQAGLAGDVRALFLKKYAGEVLAAFAEKNTSRSRTLVRTIESGE